ncbi:hypothetical protein SETIT_9G136600v2 [Setaria italica]|uniref:Uncharacterized protein n=1 Tax=Setaria italica TaxID=4555 RepID=A0A368SG79_SETIT|nr:hypothetical protein SETIT_9G136600v2 [Setaria italica]
MAEIFDMQLGTDFESVARWWVSNRKNCVLNSRNELCFQGKQWVNEKKLLIKLVRTLKSWLILCEDGHLGEMELVLEALNMKIHQPLRLTNGHSETSHSQMRELSGLGVLDGGCRGANQQERSRDIGASTLELNADDLTSYIMRSVCNMVLDDLDLDVEIDGRATNTLQDLCCFVSLK